MASDHAGAGRRDRRRRAVLAASSAFERLFGLTRSSIRGKPVEELIMPARFRSAYRARRRMVLADGPTRAANTDEFSAVRADGGEFAVELTVARTNADPPEVGTWIRDMTEDCACVARTVRRASLYEREEALAGFGSWDWKRGSGRLQWSANLFRIYGLQPGEITPRSNTCARTAIPTTSRAFPGRWATCTAPAGCRSWAIGMSCPMARCVTCKLQWPRSRNRMGCLDE
jgi:PAS domain S-box-containing protein